MSESYEIANVVDESSINIKEALAIQSQAQKAAQKPQPPKVVPKD
jgi:hypothetical protein